MLLQQLHFHFGFGSTWGFCADGNIDLNPNIAFQHSPKIQIALQPLFLSMVNLTLSVVMLEYHSLLAAFPDQPTAHTAHK